MNITPNEKFATETAAAVDLALSIGQQRILCDDGVPYTVVSKDQQVVTLEHLLDVPVRKRGTAQFMRLDSFIRYVNEHKLPVTRMFQVQNSITAIIDFHGGASVIPPGWCEHRANFTFTFSKEFVTWNGVNNRWMGQKEFAEFIEENQIDCASPTGGDMLEIALTLASSKKVIFDSAIRLQNGDSKLAYHEDTTTKAGSKGDLEIPAIVRIGIPVFDGDQARTALEARLRYEINEGTVRFQLKFIRLHDITRKATEEALKEIKAKTGIEAFVGTWNS